MKNNPSSPINTGILNALYTANGALVKFFHPKATWDYQYKKICMTVTATSSHTHVNKCRRGIFHKLLQAG